MTSSAFPVVSSPALLARGAGAAGAFADSRSRRLLCRVVLYGGGGQGADDVSPLGNHPLSVFRTVADREGFAVAYPAGTDDEWNDCRSDAPALGTVDEVAFLDAVLDRLQSDLSLGAGRTFLAGGSNGGMMAFACAFHRPARIAAVATSSASLAAKPKPGPCQTGPDRPVPFLLSHGTADPALPYAGGCVVLNVTGNC